MNKLKILNNFKDWGKEGLEFWLPTLFWLQLEIHEFELFKICFDFYDFTFEICLFGFGLQAWPFNPLNERKIWFLKSKINRKYNRIQLVASCAMYWHFFQIYNDDEDFFIEILGFRIEKKDS